MADPLEGSERARLAAHSKFDQMGEVLDKLRPGTGPGVTLLLKTAFDEGLAVEQERWISVEERLPELDFSLPSYEQHVKCMAVCESGVVAAVYERNADAKTEKGRMPRWVWYGFNRLLTGVTLWQPFPKAPAPPVHKGDS